MSDERRALADGILAEARKQAESIQAEWDQSREARKAGLKRRIDDLESETTGLIEKEQKRINDRMAAQIEMEQHKADLRLQDSAYRDVELRAAEKLRSLVGSDEYRGILHNWIVEAGVGLAAVRVTVNCSAAERSVVGEILPSVEKEISEHLGRPVKLALSADEPIEEQGVVLISEDGQTGYSNRIPDRLRRHRNLIRRIIHDSLFGVDEDG
ncbi:MAG: V-type proton ATPase subunit E [Spirochaetales bacterium]|nr:V-type proton ATPase subunit E [Spirochaetales bacterium]